MPIFRPEQNDDYWRNRRWADPYRRSFSCICSGVDRVLPISRPYKLASREFQPENSIFPLDGVKVGGDEIDHDRRACSVESRTQLLETAQAVREAGAHALRGGAYKPRTSPYPSRVWARGLEILAEARELTGLPIVTEVMRPEQIPLLARYVDVLQIGARNMQNYALLHAVGESQTPGAAQARHDRPPSKNC